MSVDLVEYSTTIEEQFVRLSAWFRGLRKEDLCPMNPEYSCVLCKHLNRKHETRGQCGRIGGSCPDFERVTEEEFAKRYQFYE